MKKKTILLAVLSAVLFAVSCQKDDRPDREQIQYNLPVGALPGEFTVNAEGKKVFFSKGNLVATINESGEPTVWKFATNQYDFLGKGGANETIGQSAGDVDLFGWSTSSTTYGISTSRSTSTYSGNFVDWGKAYCASNSIAEGTWRTLSKAEWTYLFNNHPNKWVSVNGVNGYVIAPDGFSGTLADSYPNEAALAGFGLVFLPAAGYRSGSIVYVDNLGYYWSSSSVSTTFAYRLFFRSGGVFPGSMNTRCDGFIVRLVTECQ